MAVTIAGFGFGGAGMSAGLPVYAFDEFGGSSVAILYSGGTTGGGSVKLLEGYGLTEAVTAIMGMPLHEHRPGSIGIPFPDILATICEPGTTTELPPGEEGELCVSGTAVMLGYLDNAEATAEALREHGDDRVWLHTGDIAKRDADGFFFFTSRLKRMIKSSGFNVFPAQVEAVL